MKIAIDATYSAGGDLSGVGVYSREILHGLAAAHPEAAFYFCYRPHRIARSFRVRLPRNCRRRLLGEAWTPSSADLFHGLNQRLPARGSLRRAVATFHDLFVLTGEYSTEEFRQRFAAQAREAARRASLIIAVSEFTARQVEDLLGVERGRIRVIHHGVRPRAEPPSAVRENMILHVGAVQRRKNIVRLVEAFEQAAPEWRLVLAGSLGFGADEILRRIEESPLRERIQVMGYVDDRTRADLYARAGVFAFPSLDEGFGMPALEAMAAGVPVLASNRSALPEVCGEAALLVDPSRTGDIAEGLWKLTADPMLREMLTQRGFARAARFTWDAAVGKTWEVYSELTG